MTTMRAGSRQPFSFHCTICYEIFDNVKRPPVVLPCSHTYLCAECAQRLDRCMECRTPLTIRVAAPAAAPQRQALARAQSHQVDDFSWEGIRAARQQRRQQERRVGRYGSATPVAAHTARNQAAASPAALLADPNVGANDSSAETTKISLPTPKNHVLLVLMDSVDKELAEARAHEEDDGYESGNDDGMVGRSIKFSCKTAGTYAVKCKDGLNVYSRSSTPTPVRPSSSSNAMLTASSIGPTSSPSSKLRSHIYSLTFGQTVQVSFMDDNVAYVAGNGGYIRLKSTDDLVKVGPPKYAITQMEEDREQLRRQIREMEQQLRSLRIREATLSESIYTISNDPDATINPFGPVPDEADVAISLRAVEERQAQRLAKEVEEKKMEQAENLLQQQQLADRTAEGLLQERQVQGRGPLKASQSTDTAGMRPPSMLNPPNQGYASVSFDDRVYQEIIDQERLQEHASPRSWTDFEARTAKPWEPLQDENDDVQGMFFCAATDILPNMFGGSRKPAPEPSHAKPKSVAYPAVARELNMNTNTPPLNRTDPSGPQVSRRPNHAYVYDDMTASANTHVDFKTGFSHHSGLSVAHRRNLMAQNARR